MASIFDDPTMGPNTNATKVSNVVAQNGVASLLTKTYSTTSPLATDFYSGVGTAITTNDIPIGFGRVMLSGQVTSNNVLRSDLDPTEIKKVVRFVTTEGPTKGIVGVADSKLQNVLIGGTPVATSTSQQSAIGLKEILGGVAASAGVMMGASYIKSLLDPDKDTGGPIPDSIKPLIGDNKAVDISSVKGMSVDGANDWDLMTYDAKTKKWKPKAQVDVFKKSGIGLSPLKILKDGAVIRPDVESINFLGTGVTIADVGGDDKRINITINTGSGSGSGSGGSGGGTTPPTTAACSTSLAVTTKPTSGSTYALKRNGVTLSTVKGGTAGITSAKDVASALVNSPTIPTAYSSSKFKVSASGSTISITGDATCKPCDIGTWTLDQTGSNGSSPQDPCAPRKPSLTT